jgi:hypothetical protein
LALLVLIAGEISRAMALTLTYHVQGTIESGSLAMISRAPLHTATYSDTDPSMSSGADGATYQSIASHFQMRTGGIIFSEVPAMTGPLRINLS